MCIRDSAGPGAFTQAQQQVTADMGGLGSIQRDAAGQISGFSGGTGIASFQPYLQSIKDKGLLEPTGYEAYMSPYQQDVIDTSLAAFDKQAAQQQQALRDQALGVPGAFGGGREGVQQAEYQTGSDLNRAALQAQLMQQGFGQAQSAAQQAFQNQQAIASGHLGLGQAQQQMGQQQLGLGQAQLGLSNFERAGMGADIGAYGQLGSLRQGQQQALLTADQQMKQAQAYEPYGRLGQYGQGITGLAGGVAGMQYQQPQAAGPWQSALANAIGIGGLYGKIFAS